MNTTAQTTDTTQPAAPTALKKGDRVTTSGAGRTPTWRPAVGTVLRVAGNSVFVRWDKTTLLTEDELDMSEVARAV